jgi:UDP-N-acetyl-2-amino-2-deoxyglucuronate dehydrogenase
MRLGIIGCGRVVEQGHVPALADLSPDAPEVVALADPSAQRRAAVAEALGGTGYAGYDDWRDMFARERLDVAIIALPHHLREAAIADAAAAGVHILCEKPLAMTLDEIDRITRCTEQAGVRLGVMHNWRYSADQQAALDAIRAGRIGDPFLIRNESLWGVPWASADPAHPDWRFSPAHSGGGIVIDAAYHAFYVSEAEMRSPVTQVDATLRTYGDHAAVEDTAVITLTHASGGTTTLQRSWLIRAGGARVHEIHGSAGSIRFTAMDATRQAEVFAGTSRPGSAPTDQSPAPAEIYEHATGRWSPLLAAPGRPAPWWEGMRELFRLTFQAWAKDEDSPITAANARHNLRLVLAAYESARSGRPIAVAPDERKAD